MDEDSRKAEVQRNESISIRLSEIPTNDLHKYLYLYFIISYSKTPLSLYICLTEIYKVTIACFIPTISVGFDPYSRKVLLGRPSALADQLYRSCDKLLMCNHDYAYQVAHVPGIV